MEITRSQALAILMTMDFLLRLTPEYLVEADKELCEDIFEAWPEFKNQFTILTEICK